MGVVFERGYIKPKTLFKNELTLPLPPPLPLSTSRFLSDIFEAGFSLRTAPLELLPAPKTL